MDFDPGPVIDAAAQQYGVDPDLAHAIAMQGEGNGHYLGPSARSPAGAIGTMQLMPGTAQDLGVDPADPRQNIFGGVKYLSQLSHRFNGDPALVAAAYNAGPGAVATHGGVPPYHETQNYVSRVTGALGPTPDELQSAWMQSQGIRGVTPSPGGGVKDPATGAVYTPDPSHPGQVLDAGGKSYDVTSGVPSPPDEELQAAWAKLHPPSTALLPGEEPPATVGSVAAQGAQNLGEIATNIAHTALAANPVGMMDTMARTFAPNVFRIGDLIHSALTGSAPPTEQGNAFAGLQLSPDAKVPTFDFAGPPQNFPERAARTGTGMLAGAFLGPEADASALSQLATRGANAALPALGSVGASEGVRAMGGTPEEQTLAGAAGGILGGFGAGAVAGGAPALRSALDPFLASASKGAAERQAGQALANAATDFPSARSALSTYTPMVPDSPATIGDASGDLGLIGLSRATVTKNPTLNAGLVAGQNEARAKSLQTLSPNADPMAAQQHVRGLIDKLDSQTQADVDQAVQAAQAKTAEIGGNAGPEQNGATIRAAAQGALDASNQRESALWKAIDPDGTLTGNVSATRLAAKSIISDMSRYDTPLSADEQRIFAQAQALPDVAKLSDIVALRKSINAAASTELRTNGSTPTYARLSALRGALAENMSSTIGDAVEANPGLAERLAGSRGQAPNSVAAYGGRGSGDAGLASGGTPGATGALGAEVPAGSGLGGGPGNQSLSSEALSPDLTPIQYQGKTVGYTTPTGQQISVNDAASYRPTQAPQSPAAPSIQPTIDTAAQGRMAAANAATAEQGQTFRAGPVGAILKSGPFKGQYPLPDGRVPGQFFHSGPTGYSDMAALAKASPEALPAIQDFAASTLRDMATDPDTGAITPKGFTAWQRRYGESIRALPPELQAKFADAATAGQTVADAAATRAATMKTAQSGAIGKILGATNADEVTSYVGQIIRSPTAQSDLTSLVNATRSNPDALAGLKQAVVDHITNTLTSNTEAATSGTNKLKADQFQSFAAQKVPALVQSGVLTAQEGARLTAIADDIQQSQRTLGATKLAGQSNTTQDLHSTGLPGAGKPSLVLDSLLSGLAGIGGVAAHGALGAAVVEPAAFAASHLMQVMRANGIAKVNDLVQRAVVDPKLFSALTARIKGPQDIAGATRAVIRALTVPVAIAASPKPQAPRSALDGVSP